MLRPRANAPFRGARSCFTRQRAACLTPIPPPLVRPSPTHPGHLRARLHSAVADALYHEKAILSTMDVTTDGFGFMLCFGDLSWVPFTYALPARYLATRGAAMAPLSTSSAVAITALFACGYSIFRLANSEKVSY